MLDEIRALIRAREAPRSSGQAVARVSDPNTGVEHHHTPLRVSGSGVSAVSKPSGPDMADASTPRGIPDCLAPWCVAEPIRLVRTPSVTTYGGCGRHQYGAPLRPWRYE
eukprot:6179876-Pleurochrysis_carterae.AAC.1